jgi:peptide/nickel transport system ATP-binding protein
VAKRCWRNIRTSLAAASLYITHDLSTAYQIGNQIYILYQGSVAEKGDTVTVIENPKHPYVQLLIESIPVPDPNEKWDTDVKLPSEEELRSRIDSGCRFYPRCKHRMDRCLASQPPLYTINGADHHAACFLYDENTPETAKVPAQSVEG